MVGGVARCRDGGDRAGRRPRSPRRRQARDPAHSRRRTRRRRAGRRVSSASGAQPMIGAPVARASGRAAGLWSRWVWVHMIAATGRPPIAASSASRCSGRSGPGSITATSPVADQIGLRAVISECRRIVREHARNAGLQLLEIGVRRVHGCGALPRRAAGLLAAQIVGPERIDDLAALAAAGGCARLRISTRLPTTPRHTSGGSLKPHRLAACEAARAGPRRDRRRWRMKRRLRSGRQILAGTNASASCRARSRSHGLRRYRRGLKQRSVMRGCGQRAPRTGRKASAGTAVGRRERRQSRHIRAERPVRRRIGSRVLAIGGTARRRRRRAGCRASMRAISA